MIEYPYLKLKKQKLVFRHYKNKISEIYDMYWSTIPIRIEKIIENVISVEVQHKFKFTIPDILKKFELTSVQEVIFLIMQDHRSLTERLTCCEDGYMVNIRTGKFSPCGHVQQCNYVNKCKNNSKNFYPFCEYHQAYFEKVSGRIGEKTNFHRGRLNDL